jgi:hypothetical protein
MTNMGRSTSSNLGELDENHDVISIPIKDEETVVA